MRRIGTTAQFPLTSQQCRLACAPRSLCPAAGEAERCRFLGIGCTMVTLDDLLKLFAQSIHAKATALRTLELTASQRARLRESISDDIKKCTNFIPPEVSVAAHDEAQPLGVDLSTKNWHDQPSFDAGREIFHFEHIVPVSAIRTMCESAESADATFSVLRTKLRVAWILKREDLELTRLGYRSERADPDAAYEHAKINFRNKA